MTLVALALSGLAAPLVATVAGPLDRPEFDEPMGLDFIRIPVATLYELFSKAGGVPFKLDPEVTGTVTVHEPRTTIRKALELVAEQRGLAYRAEDDSIRVGLRASPSANESGGRGPDREATSGASEGTAMPCTARVLESAPSAAMVEFTWSPVKGAHSYRLVVASNKGLQKPVVDRSGIRFTSQSTRGLPLALYYWRVETAAGGRVCGVQELDLRSVASP
jgi:hypothetical protein